MKKYRVTGHVNVHIVIDDEVESDSNRNAVDLIYNNLEAYLCCGKVMDCDLDAEAIND